MKFTIDKTILTNALKLAQEYTTNNEIITSSAGIVGIILDEDHVRLNHLLPDGAFITYLLEANIVEYGYLKLHTRPFANLLNVLPDGPVEFACNGTPQVTVKASNITGTVQCIEQQTGQFFADDPTLDDPPIIASAKVDAAVLQEVIKHVTFAACETGERPILKGVKVQISGDQATFAAANGFQLSVRTARLSAPAEQEISVVIQAASLSILEHILANNPGTVQIAFDDEFAFFIMENARFVAQLLKGKYPDYECLIPEKSSTCATLTTREFQRICEAGCAIGAINERIIIDVSSDDVAVSAVSVDKASVQATIPAKVLGNVMTVDVDANLLLGALSVIDEPEVEVRMNTPISPIAVCPVGRDDFTYVVMPMRPEE